MSQAVNWFLAVKSEQIEKLHYEVEGLRNEVWTFRM